MEVRSVPYQEPFRNETKGPLERTNVKHGLIMIRSNYLFGTRDLFNISYSRELFLFSKFLHFEEIVRAKMAVCFEMIVSET